jgi:hypothetical protein
LSLLARERPIDGGKLIILIFADGGPPDSDSPRALRIAGISQQVAEPSESLGTIVIVVPQHVLGE